MSLLPSIQRPAGLALAAVTILLVADSAVLLATGTASGIVPAVVQAHLWLGYAFGGLLCLFVGAHLLTHLEHPNGQARVRGVVLLLLVGAGIGTGLWLAWYGKSGERRFITVAHVSVFSVAVVGYFLHRLAAVRSPILLGERRAVLASVALAAVAMAVHRFAPQPVAVQPARAPFEPGATRARTVDGHVLDAAALADSTYCAQCHEEVAKQWTGSAHRHSSFTDPFYAATFANLQKHATPEATRFCGGCHDPLVVLAGEMNGQVDKDSPFAQEGITCLVCHGVTEVRGRQGVGGYVLAPPQHYPYYGSADPDEQEENRRLIRSRPEQHKERLLKPEIHRDPSFCLPCHKAHIPVEVNGERWRRGQNDWDAWLDSSASMRSARTFFHRDDVKRCQDCHMPEVESQDPAARDGKIRSHRFASANTALAHVHGDAAWKAEIDKLLVGSASIDLFALDVGGERLFPLEDAGIRWPTGRPAIVEAVVRNQRTGHLFPGGTVDLAEVWVELSVEVEGGPHLVSGLVGPRGDLDVDAHRLHNILLDGEGRRLPNHEVESMRAVLYNRALQLGTSDVVRFQVPALDLAVGAQVDVVARLMHRKFPQAYVRFSLGEEAPELPVVVVAEDRVEVALGAAPAGGAVIGEKDVPRALDHGIGSLLAGDSRSARQMFGLASSIRPTDPDPEVYLARAAISDGAIDEAEGHLRAADTRRPGWWKTAWTLGRVRLAQGRIQEAVEAFERVLGRFPEDRVVLNDTGSALLDLGRYPEARGMFERALRVDPEDIDAHSGLARALEALGDDGGAKEHRDLADRFRPPREELSVHGLYRAQHPEADREASDPHVHPLAQRAPDERRADTPRPATKP